MGLRSTFFSIAHWAANRRHAAEPALAYAQHLTTEQYGGITMAPNKQRAIQQTIAAQEGLI